MNHTEFLFFNNITKIINIFKNRYNLSATKILIAIFFAILKALKLNILKLNIFVNA